MSSNTRLILKLFVLLQLPQTSIFSLGPKSITDITPCFQVEWADHSSHLSATWPFVSLRIPPLPLIVPSRSAPSAVHKSIMSMLSIK